MLGEMKKKSHKRSSPAIFLHDGRQEEIMRALEEELPVQFESEGRARATYFDTFDWRLHRRDLALIKVESPEQQSIELQSFVGGVCAGLRIEKVPPFAWEFPAGPLRDRISSYLEMRRLVPIAVVESRISRSRVLNSNGKTVARLSFRDSTASSPNGAVGRPMAGRMRVEPVRGYHRPFRKLVSLAEEQLGLDRAGSSPLDEALQVLGRTPRDYSSKLALQIDPGERADVSLKRILATLFDTMLRNEKGTKDDEDSEFLHDFRVAIRRTRSALTQIRGVLPPESVSYFKQEFSWLGTATGPTRDLDVYLLKMPTYQRVLGEKARIDLNPLREFLERKQIEEQQRLCEVLESDRYRRIVRDWRAFLDEPVAEDSELPNASRAIVDVARARIWKTFRKVIRDGTAIEPESPAESLHRLRIDCKKLRYLLEFFRTLFESRTMRELIFELKRLQVNLGDFNDYEVQQSRMEEFADEILSQGAVSARTLLAMGRLVEKLEEGQNGERRRFHKIFDRFSSARNRKSFRCLFHKTVVEGPQEK